MTPIEQVEFYGKEILNSEQFNELDSFLQHGNTTLKGHCINVAVKAIKFVDKYKINCDKKSLVIGCLLHDFFLYDWHDRGNRFAKFHAFTHPTTALQNAELLFDLSEKSKDVIKKHMWPTTIIPPTQVESWIIVWVDKQCAIKETFSRKLSIGY